MAGCIKQIGVLESGDLNPEQSRDTERKIDPTEEDPLVALGRLMYEKDESGNKRASWNGVVMRVDKFEDGVATCKVRIPEKDMIPEPRNFVPANVKDPSHSVIDMHRDYVGKTPVAPVIGQVVKVSVPHDNSLTKKGELLEVTDQKYFLPAKSTEEGLGTSAKAAVSTGEDPDASVAGASGDTVGSGEMDPSTQVPPTLDTPELEPLPDEEAAIDNRKGVRLVFHKSIPNGIRIVVENENGANIALDETKATMAAKDEYKYEIDASAYTSPTFIAQEILQGDVLNPKDTRYIYFCEAK